MGRLTGSMPGPRLVEVVATIKSDRAAQLAFWREQALAVGPAHPRFTSYLKNWATVIDYYDEVESELLGDLQGML